MVRYGDMKSIPQRESLEKFLPRLDVRIEIEGAFVNKVWFGNFSLS